MKYITLASGEKSLVDDKDFQYLNKMKWHMGTKGYAMRNQFSQIKKSIRKIYMHTMIMKTPSGMHIDHINQIH